MFKYICIFVGSVGFLLLLSLFFRWLVLCQVRSILRRKEPEVILIVDDIKLPSALMRGVKEWFRRQLNLEAMFVTKFRPAEHGNALIVEEVGDVVYVQLQDITGTEEYQCPCHLGHCQVTCLKALGHNAM